MDIDRETLAIARRRLIVAIIAIVVAVVTCFYSPFHEFLTPLLTRWGEYFAENVSKHACQEWELKLACPPDGIVEDDPLTPEPKPDPTYLPLPFCSKEDNIVMECYHRVQKDDTLADLAYRYWNSLEEYDFMQICYANYTQLKRDWETYLTQEEREKDFPTPCSYLRVGILVLLPKRREEKEEDEITVPGHQLPALRQDIMNHGTTKYQPRKQLGR